MIRRLFAGMSVAVCSIDALQKDTRRNFRHLLPPESLSA